MRQQVAVLALFLLVILPAAKLAPPAAGLAFRLYDIRSGLAAADSKSWKSSIERIQADVIGIKGDIAAIRRVRMTLGWPVASFVSILPMLGPPVRAGDALIDSAPDLMDLAEAGLQAALVILPAQAPTATDIPTSLADGLELAAPHISRAAQSAKIAERKLAGADPSDLPGLLGTGLGTAKEMLPPLSKALAILASGADALPGVLGDGEEKRFLILAQDQGELRATGGYIGNYGLLALKDGKITEFYLRDVMSLDKPFYQSTGGIPLLPVFQRYLPEATWWGLRDSNISPDFPSAAREAERLFLLEGGAPSVDGVIALTVNSLRVLLRSLGPVEVSEFGEVISADNVEERIRYHQYNAPPPEVMETHGIGENWMEQRKLFTALLAQAVFQRISHLKPRDFLPLLGSLEELMLGKDIQAYFNDQGLQEMALTGDFAGQIKKTSGDYLFLVDSNLSVNKANIFVEQSAQYQVEAKDDDTTVATLRITYDFTRPGDINQGLIKRDFYGDYLRVYVPYGSELLASEGTDHEVERGWDLGKTVFLTFLEIRPGTKRTLTLSYKLPFLATSLAGNVRDRASGVEQQYELTVQKQAGADIRTLQVELDLPGQVSVSKPGSFRVEDDRLLFQGSLDRDLFLTTTLKER